MPRERPTSHYSKRFDYDEAQKFKDKYPIAYIGNVKLGILGEMAMDVKKQGEQSDHWGKFFCPDRCDRNVKENKPGEWTSGKNRAFMAGAIDAGRSFLLVSPIEFYARKMYGTGSEILQLFDNGYTFEPYSKEHPEWTLIRPPQTPKEARTIVKYWSEQADDVIDKKATFTKMDALIETVLNERERQFGMRRFKIETQKAETKSEAPRKEGAWRRASQVRSDERPWRGRSESQAVRSMSWRKEESKSEVPKAKLGSGSPLKRNYSVSDARKENRQQGSPPKKPFNRSSR